MQKSEWIIHQPNAQRRFRLYCFSYAGGGAASYLPWQTALDPGIEICAVQLPGRGARLHETPYTSWPELIQQLALATVCQNNLPYAFFGHSLGGLVAFELARFCKRYLLPMPRRLFVSGCAAPQRREPFAPLHELGDDALIEKLKEYDGTPPELLSNRELMALVLPTVRADFALVANYRYRPTLPLETPITILAGRSDDRVSEAQAEGWRAQTTGDFRLHWFEGGHFFIHSARHKVLDCLAKELEWHQQQIFNFS
ncbi:MAG TPA: alpha/beta fold hydrolase [Paucimonas sp.]|nr:alpha/beta fold hydrolase [Paucimonas sp.]